MHIKQRVYVNKHEHDLNWYKATIVDIRRKKRAKVLLPCWDCLTCWKCRPWEYVVEFQDKTRQAVLRHQLQTQL